MEYKRLNDINTFASSLDNETYISGTDENGNDITVIFDTIDVLQWIDTEYMKKQAKKYIDTL
jgi:hypothetical protein